MRKTEEKLRKNRKILRYNDFPQNLFCFFALILQILTVQIEKCHQTLIVIIHRCGTNFKQFRLFGAIFYSF